MRVLSQVEVEDRILRVVDEMERRTHDFEKLSTTAADAEADYRELRAINLIQYAATGVKTTAAEREARADAATATEHRVYLLAKASRDSCRESLASMREQLNALRTLAANIRGQT